MLVFTFFPNLCSYVRRKSVFSFTSLLCPRKSGQVAQAVIFLHNVAKDKQKKVTDTGCHFFHNLDTKIKPLIIKFTIIVNVFWTHFETN